MSIEVKQMLCPESKYSIKCPYTMNATRIVVHNTANDAPAKNEVSYMINNNNQVSFHFAVDGNEVWQGIPLNRNAWHAGDGNGKGNREGIGIEICYSLSGGDRFVAAEKNAAKFIAQLLKERNWGVDKVTKHQDYSGKYCPHRTLDMGWNRFIDMIKAELGETPAPAPTPTPTNTLQAGAKLQLSGVALYASSTTTTKSTTVTGTYYVWDDDVVNGRIRITNSTSNVGKAGQVTGWVNVSDVSGTVSNQSKPAVQPTTSKSSFFPSKGYFSIGDTHVNVGKIATFMYNTFPAYTKKSALGNYYGVNIQASIKEFQRRTGLKVDGCVGSITLGELKKYGFKE